MLEGHEQGEIMGVRFRVDAIRSLAFGGISGTYANVGGPIAQQSRLVHVVNNTDGDLMFSFNARTDHVFVPAGSFFLYDVNTNRDTNEQGWYITVGSQPAVKSVGSAPTSGSVYVTIAFGGA